LLREIFACNAEISLRDPAATKTGASDNAPGDRAKKSLHSMRPIRLRTARDRGRSKEEVDVAAWISRIVGRGL
jgi:hypothetical protein